MQISPVQWALRDSANILGQGLNDIGRQNIRTEELGLRRALQERQINRENEERSLTLPAKELARDEALRRKADLDSPVTIGMLSGGDQYVLGWLANKSKNDPSGKMPIEKVADLYGVKYDTDEKSQTRGQFLKEDGTPLTKRDFNVKWREATDILKSHFDPEQGVQDQVARYQDALKWHQAQGTDQNDPKVRFLQDNVRKANELLHDPEKKLKMLQKWRGVVSKIENDDAKRETALLDQKIAKTETDIQELKKTSLTKEADLTKMLYQEGRKDARAKLASDTRLKAADKVAGGKAGAVKLSPQDEAEKQTLLSEYRSNLKVIENYRNNQDIPPHNASAARKENQQIVKKLKKLGIEPEESGNQKQNLDPLGLFDDEEEEE